MSAFSLPVLSRPVPAVALSVPRNSPVSLNEAVAHNDKKRSRDELEKTASQLFDTLSLKPSTANLLEEAIDVLQSLAVAKDQNNSAEKN